MHWNDRTQEEIRRMINEQKGLATGMKVAKIVEREIVDETILEKGKRIAINLGLFGTQQVDRHNPMRPYYPADDIHKLLGSGLHTVGNIIYECSWESYEKQIGDNETFSHQGIVVGIKPREPIVPESRADKMEGLLREFVNFEIGCADDYKRNCTLVERAKKLLGESK